jgi:hypothetical protein
MITLDTIELPADLWWQDETAWTPVEQAEPSYNVDGSMVVESATRQAGRPITLAGDESAAWVSYQTVLDLMAYAAVAGKEMVLTLHDGRTFNVMFRYHDGGPLTATPVALRLPPAADDEYWLVLRLMEI